MVGFGTPDTVSIDRENTAALVRDTTVHLTRNRPNTKAENVTK